MYLKTLIPALLLFVSFQLPAQNVPSYLPTQGLVGWWPFSGNAIDSSGAGNNGTVFNASLVSDRFGKPNAAYAFNGTNSRIEMADAVSLRCRKISISAWVFSNTTSGGQVVYKGDMYAGGEAYSFNTNPMFSLKSGSNCSPGLGWKSIQLTQPISVGSWEHFVATFDGVTFKVYRNGQVLEKMPLSGLIDSCLWGGLRFGFNHTNYGTSGDPFNGVIDDIGIWNRALTETEIGQMFGASMDCNNVGNLGVNMCIPQRSLHVKDVMRLEPRSFSPPNPGKGDIYFDGTINKLRVYDGTTWQNCW